MGTVGFDPGSGNHYISEAPKESRYHQHWQTAALLPSGYAIVKTAALNQHHLNTSQKAFWFQCNIWMGRFFILFPCYLKIFNRINSNPPILLGIGVMFAMNSVTRRYVSGKDWDISRSPVSLCSLMLMKGNHFLHTVKGNRWCHSSAVEFKQSDNLYSRSSSWVKFF